MRPAAPADDEGRTDCEQHYRKRDGNCGIAGNTNDNSNGNDDGDYDRCVSSFAQPIHQGPSRFPGARPRRHHSSEPGSTPPRRPPSWASPVIGAPPFQNPARRISECFPAELGHRRGLGRGGGMRPRASEWSPGRAAPSFPGVPALAPSKDSNSVVGRYARSNLTTSCLDGGG